MKRLIWVALFVLPAFACFGGDDDGGDGGDDSDAAPSADGGAGIDASLAPDAGPDTTAPAMATGFTATGSTAGIPQIDLAWTNPTDADFAGVLVLRRFRAPVADTPTDGTEHVVGTMIGDSEVVFTGTDATALDTAVIGGNEYHYAVHAFDTERNYAAAPAASARPAEFFDGVIMVPAADGPITVLHPDALPSITITGDVVFADGGATVTLQFVNEADRILFNPKLTVANESGGAAYANPAGILDDVPFAYFGPTGLASDATSPSVAFTFRNIAEAFTYDVDLLTHPSLFVSQQSGALSVIDSGQDAEVANPTVTAGIWYSVLSSDGSTVYASGYGTPDLFLFDTTTNAVRTSIALPLEPPGTATGKGGGGDGHRVAGIALSADETRAYVASSISTDLKTGDSTLFLFEIDVTTTPPVEIARIDLGTHPTNTSTSIARGVIIDRAENRAFVANYGNGLIHVVDLTTGTEVDTDDDAANGVTPITFGKGQEAVKTMVINPAGTHLYVGFGQRASADIAEIALADLATITTLPITSPAQGSGTNLHFGPDGRLYVPRTGYPFGDAADVDSFGISVFDLSADPVTESLVQVPGSNATGNDDIWDIKFPPGTNRGYASMCDAADLFVFDLTTLLPIDIDGDATNGHTNLVTTGGRFYGGSLLLSH